MMGKAKLKKCCSDSDSSDQLSSDDDQYTLGYERQYRLSALTELQEVIVQGYSTASKALQSCIFEDLIAAVQQLDSRQQVFEATACLVAAAKRVLPQQKRNQLVKEHKQAAVAGRRAARRQQASSGLDSAVMSGESDDDESSAVMLGDVPLEVIQSILQALDPLSLSAAACVCRSWRELALSDELWQQHLHLVFSAAARCQYRKQPMQQQQQQSRQLQQNLTSSTAAPYGLDSSHSLTEGHRAAGVAVQDSSTAAMDSIILSGSHHLLQQQSQHQCQHQGAYQRFRQAAQRHPSTLLPWRSCRALLCARLQWIPPGDARAPRAAAAARAARRGMSTPGPVYVTTQQAVAWMMGKPWSDVLRNSTSNSSDGATDSDSGSSSDGSESHIAKQAFQSWKL